MAETSSLMRGKRGLIMGVANNRSIAWGIARACRDHGADLAFTYQGEALKKRVEPLAEEVDGLVVGHCDVTDPASLDAVFAAVESAWGSLDFVLHAIAFSDKDQLDGRYVDTTADNFTQTMLVSCYSFTAVAQRAEKLMTNGGSMLTLTYYGAEKWMPHYNVMGLAKAALESSVRYLAADLGVKNIRVNAISSGPIKTLAASGIGDFRYILKWNEYNTPLRRNVTLDDVGKTGVYFLVRHVERRDRRDPPRRRRLSHRRHQASRRAGFHGQVAHDPERWEPAFGKDHAQFKILAVTAMPPPTIYYLRHGETDWNVAGRLQGRRDIPLNARGRAQGAHCGEILRDLFARDKRDPNSLDYLSSPLQRACETMELARTALGLSAQEYRREPRLAEIAFGEWEGFTIAQLHERDPARIAQREHDKWHFVPPGGESYEMMSARMREWYKSLERDAVVTSHGGTARGLIAHLGIAKPAAAPLLDIAQGVVYVFEGERLTRYT